MSKRRKSRFIKKDVDTICEMQRKIDAYENFIILLAGMVRRKDTKVVCLQKGIELDDIMNGLWKEVRNMIKEKEYGNEESSNKD